MKHLLQSMKRLTRREYEILTHIANGLSSKQIADKLGISNNTVANHRKNMRLKMGVRSTIELLRTITSDSTQPQSTSTRKIQKAFQKSLL